MTYGPGILDLRRRRAELVVERNRLYDLEAFLSAASRVSVRVPGEPVRDGVFRTCGDIRLRTEAVQNHIDELDRLRGLRV